MKANTVRLPSLATAVPSQQRGDRTDGPRLWDKASPGTPALAPGKMSGAQKGERPHTAGLARFISLSVLQVAEVGHSQDCHPNPKYFVK